jgi:hypothetical protein
MFSPTHRPKWWQLYLTFPLLIALFAVDARLKLSVRGHQAVQIGILLLVYGLIHLWLKANSPALSRTDQSQEHGRITVIRIPVRQLPDTGTDSILKLPASEIKGVLSDTFDVDAIEAESLPLDEVPEGLKKE